MIKITFNLPGPDGKTHAWKILRYDKKDAMYKVEIDGILKHRRIPEYWINRYMEMIEAETKQKEVKNHAT